MEEEKGSPPISAVLTSPALRTSKVAVAMLFAIESRLERQSKEKAYAYKLDLPKVSKHHRRAEDHRGWIGSVGTHDI